jgi:beta-N-acetylhexosaminidase
MTTATTVTTSAGSSCADVVAVLPVRRRLAQLLMVGVDPSRIEPSLDLAGAVGVGGIFIGGNDTTLLADDRLAAVQAAAELPLAVGVDEEGGRVQRIDALDGRIPSARVMAATMTVDQVRDLAGRRGAALRARGVTIDFAPVVDVTEQPDGAVIGDRSFGMDPEVVTRYAAAFSDGLRDGGILPVVKHFPGHGRASGDSHRSSAVAPPLADLWAVDLVPYRRLLGDAPVAVMVGHMDVPGLTAGRPATLSAETYRLLRQQFAFTGVAITDDLGGMKAVTGRYSLPEAVLTALEAGADIAFWSSGGRVDEVLDALEGGLASGRLSNDRVNEALNRVLRVKGVCDD